MTFFFSRTENKELKKAFIAVESSQSLASTQQPSYITITMYFIQTATKLYRFHAKATKKEGQIFSLENDLEKMP